MSERDRRIVKHAIALLSRLDFVRSISVPEYALRAQIRVQTEAAALTFALEEIERHYPDAWRCVLDYAHPGKEIP